MSTISTKGRRYVLVTAAYNEDLHIERLIKSVLALTERPIRWVIVSDGSIDRTDEIVQQYVAQCSFIKLIRIDDEHPRNFAAQVSAINTGLAGLKDLDYDFIGNLDADVSFGPTYFSEVLNTFADDPGLGLAGGSIFEERESEFRARPLNREYSVAQAAQLFRRACFEDLGGEYVPLPYGGADWYAVVKSRMIGWRVRSITELKVFHYRPSGYSGWLRASIRQGRMDYSLGTHPLFEIPRLIRRLGSRPPLLYAVARLAGFLFSYFGAEKRMVSEEFVRFLRQEEAERLRRFFRKPANIEARMASE
jgi:glycosyltransferase involved in cell wall biosynthesis